MKMSQKSFLCFLTVFVFANSVVVQRGRHNPAAINGASAIVPEKYIAGGHPAEIGQFPWIVFLSITDRSIDETFSCGGSLIRVQHVLTAAHCFDHNIKYFHDVEIYLGEYDLASYLVDCARGKCTKNILTYPDKIIIHENYGRSEFADDIALLRLRERARLSAYIKIIPLPPFDIDIPRNKDKPVAVIGWGGTENSNISSNILLTTELNLIPQGECKSRASDVPDNHLCARSNKGRDTCPGDSGGPLLMYHNNKFYVSGIVSYGPNRTCGTADIGFYTNVFKYIKWIKQNTRMYKI